jgi:serine/threonine protein kinase/tetratricopeptide (TPR) repeat protein
MTAGGEQGGKVGTVSLAATQAEKLDQFCDRFEAAWKAGECPRIEEHLAGAPESLRPAFLRELLAIELDWRNRRGQRPQPGEYYGRFPREREVVEAAFGAVADRATGSLGSPAPLDPAGGLLLGLLALKNDFVDRRTLLEALSSWVVDKGTSLGRILIARGALDEPTHALLEALSRKHIDINCGDIEKSLAALVRDHSVSEVLAQVVDTDIQATLTHIYTNAGTTGLDPESAATAESGDSRGRARRFQILRPHARGGLGAVFVALDSELNREVALKQILDRHADDPVSRQRFLLEAEITGGLEHPGIVPVYGLGSHDDGRPYYAMRFIKGESLKEAIERFHGDESDEKDPGRRSLALRKLLRRFLDVCNAIDYAQSRGVLHRDIKPANIILGNHGETLVVDWGLAKAIGSAESSSDEQVLRPSATSGSAQTLPGSALGTPAYMSPEQAGGNVDQLGPRSDVYSLGTTLYCLLTGRAPFDGEVGEVLRQVQEGTFAPPRRVDPSIDQALEAICLKAMALSPEARYATPRALADDLERSMADEPVSAWREPWRRRVRRWLARHRSLVASAAAALLFVTVVSAAAAVLVESARRQEASAHAARARALEAEIRAKAEADQRLKEASDVVETFLSTASDDLARVQGAQQIRRRLLKQAADYFARVSRERRSDPELEYEAFRTTYRSGVVHRMLGELEEAIALYRDGAARGEELLRTAPGSPRYLALLASTHIELGVCTLGLGRAVEAESAYRRAIELHNQALASDPDDAETVNNLASAHNNLGILIFEQGKHDQAEIEYARAIELRRTLSARRPDVPKYLNDLGSSLTNLGRLKGDRGELREALRLQQESVAVRERLIKLDPGNPNYLRGLVISRMNLAEALGHTGTGEEALPVLSTANAELSALVEHNPSVPEFRGMRANGLISLTEVLSRLGRWQEAREAIATGVRESEDLTQRAPDIPQYRFVFCLALINYASVLDNLKQYTEAERAAKRACDETDALVAKAGSAPTNVRMQAMARMTRGTILHHLGSDGEAEPALRSAAELFGALARSQPDSGPVQDDLGLVHEQLAGFYKDRRQPQAFLSAVDKAMAHRRAAAAKAPELPQPVKALAELHRERSEALLMLGHPVEASAEADRLAALRPGHAEDLIAAARVLAQAAGATSGQQAETYAARAVELLQSAQRTGKVDLAPLTQASDFAALRSHTCFQWLVKGLTIPGDPFAH